MNIINNLKYRAKARTKLMKKILSTLVMCLIFGVSYSYGITVTAKAVINDHNTSGGGTVQAHIVTKEGRLWDTWDPGPEGETSPVSSTLSQPEYSADVKSTNNGYYFYQWEEENGTKKRCSVRNFGDLSLFFREFI